MYVPEGDGPFAFKRYDHIQTLKAGSDNAQYPNVNALAHHLSTRGHISQQYATRCVKVGLDYFKSKLCSDSAQLKDTFNCLYLTG